MLNSESLSSDPNRSWLPRSLYPDLNKTLPYLWGRSTNLESDFHSEMCTTIFIVSIHLDTFLAELEKVQWKKKMFASGLLRGSNQLERSLENFLWKYDNYMQSIVLREKQPCPDSHEQCATIGTFVSCRIWVPHTRVFLAEMKESCCRLVWM